MGRSKDKCPDCGGNPEDWLRRWKSGEEPEIWKCCLLALKPRLVLKSKTASRVARSKKIENEVSRYLFGHDRDWKDLHDVSGDGWIGEVKDRALSTLSSEGGPVGMLETALAQAQSVAEGKRTFAVLHLKNSRDLSKCLVLLDDSRLMTLSQFKALLQEAR